MPLQNTPVVKIMPLQNTSVVKIMPATPSNNTTSQEVKVMPTEVPEIDANAVPTANNEILPSTRDGLPLFFELPTREFGEVPGDKPAPGGIARILSRQEMFSWALNNNNTKEQ